MMGDKIRKYSVKNAYIEGQWVYYFLQLCTNLVYSFYVMDIAEIMYVEVL